VASERRGARLCRTLGLFVAFAVASGLSRLPMRSLELKMVRGGIWAQLLREISSASLLLSRLWQLGPQGWTGLLSLLGEDSSFLAVGKAAPEGAGRNPQVHARVSRVGLAPL